MGKIFPLLRYSLWCLLTLVCLACSDHNENPCPAPSEILDEMFIDTEDYLLTTDGEIYLSEGNECHFVQKYFDPDFITKNYTFENGITYAIAPGQRIRVKKGIDENFERHSNFTDLFISSLADTSDNWTDFTAQSPANPTIEDYVQLRKCVLDGTCAFEDNQMDLVADPVVAGNKCLKLFAQEPLPSMVTSKSSIENTLFFVDKGDEIWFEADYYIDEGMPFTLVDLENRWFDGSPGIRVMIKDRQHLAVELKYGSKPTYRQTPGTEIALPVKQWFHLQVYYLLDDEAGGKIKVWQDGTLLIDTEGKTLPTSNSVQTSLEVGISATSETTTVYLDNVKTRVANH